MATHQLIANHFKINNPETDLLGKGGMGSVYRAVDTQTGEFVAVKALHKEIVDHHPDIVKRFIREGEALRDLNHPNIVKMLATVEETGQYYLIIEYVEGGSLADLLQQQGRLPVDRTLEIALDLSDALIRAHRLNIIHRDLKPDNVLLAGDGTPRLTDFGIAHMGQQTTQLTQTGTIIGTVNYLSPESCLGEEIDLRADIWAYGVMLFEMLTGVAPFHGDTVASTLLAIVHNPPPNLVQLRPDIPLPLVNLIYRMLEKDKSHVSPV